MKPKMSAPTVSEAAARMREHSASVQALAKKLRDNPPILEREDVLEKQLLFKANEWTPNGKVLGVDGGIAVQSLAGADIVVSRAVAACFQYQKGKLLGTRYRPNGIAPLEVRVENSFDAAQISWLKALERLSAELLCTLDSMLEFEPEVVLLDGSIVPQVSDKPPKELELNEEYQELLGLYTGLFGNCEARDVVLAGVIKDSRGKRFLQLLQESGGLSKEEHALLEGSNDTVFLHHLLAPGERTFAFKYSHSAAQHSILRDFGKYKDQVYTMYLRPAPMDRPLRVDFLLPEGKGRGHVDKVAGIVNALCSQNQSYAHPAVLIEVDLRAALRPEEVENVIHDLSSQAGLGPGLLTLRRDSRPFR